MSISWFSRQHQALIKEISEKYNINEDEVLVVYNALCNRGFIDYDTEKELFWRMEENA